MGAEHNMSRAGQAAGANELGIVLGMLSAVERDNRVTQRHLARELGIALGLANAYLRRCATKGFIKVKEVPVNRYAYYLTPRGFAEKSRLTALYLSTSFDFFRRARRDCAELLADCAANGGRQVALWGAGDLAEIALLSAFEAGIDVVAIIDPAMTAKRVVGKNVVSSLSRVLEIAGAAGLDAIIVTDTNTPRPSFDAALAAAGRSGIPARKVMAPQLLQAAPSSGASAGHSGRPGG
jgi:hypothetical protein